VIVTITYSSPKFGQPNFAEEMLAAIHSVSDPLVAKVKSETPYPSIANAYYQEDLSTPAAVHVSIGNKSDIWIFRERDTRPHWPPWYPDSSLDKWAKAHDISTFLVARKISRLGTTGNHLFENAWRDAPSAIRSAIQSATYAYVLGRIGGTP
jgi:hypothetical protein